MQFSAWRVYTSFLSLFLDSFCLGMFQTAFSKFRFLVFCGDAEIALLGSLRQIPALLSIHLMMSGRFKLPFSHLQSGGYTQVLGACQGFDPQHRLPSLVYVILPTCCGSSQCRLHPQLQRSEHLSPSLCDHPGAVTCTLGCQKGPLAAGPGGPEAALWEKAASRGRATTGLSLHVSQTHPLWWSFAPFGPGFLSFATRMSLPRGVSCMGLEWPWGQAWS